MFKLLSVGLSFLALDNATVSILIVIGYSGSILLIKYPYCVISGARLMNHHLVLKLMTLPTFIGSLLILGSIMDQASAINTSQAMALTSSQASCDLSLEREFNLSVSRHYQQGVTVASAGPLPAETAMLDFSEAESDAAAVLFGCDCPACINALRTLQSQLVFKNSNSQGHCLASLQRRVSPQRMQEVLENLETEEAEAGRSVVRE